MKISIQEELMRLLNSSRLGVISAKIRCGSSSDNLIEKIENTVVKIRNQLNLDEIKSLEVVASTRKAYRIIGNDPNRYRPSADALLRRIVKGSHIYRINNVVDTLNLVSIQSGFSIGGYDIDKIIGDIELGIGKKNEPYEGIGRGELNISNLPVLRDARSAFGNPTSDSERTMITDSTNKTLFIFFDFGNHSSLLQYLDTCSELLKRFCDAGELHSEIVEFQL